MSKADVLACCLITTGSSGTEREHFSRLVIERVVRYYQTPYSSGPHSFPFCATEHLNAGSLCLKLTLILTISTLATDGWSSSAAHIANASTQRGSYERIIYLSRHDVIHIYGRRFVRPRPGMVGSSLRVCPKSTHDHDYACLRWKNNISRRNANTEGWWRFECRPDSP
jgi:hypothetical protein